jgi:hypothetical protein
MPSLRPQPGAPARADRKRGSTPAKPAQRVAQEPERRDDEDDPREGGFYESSYELRTGMDIVEGDWPDDTTIPGEFRDD